MKKKEFSKNNMLGTLHCLVRYNDNTCVSISRMYYKDGTAGEYNIRGYKARQGKCLHMHLNDKKQLTKVINMLFLL